MELRTFQSTVITRRLPKNAVMERGIFSAIKKIFRFCHFGLSMQNGDSKKIVAGLPKSSVVLFKVVIFQRCLLRLKKVMARVIFRASPTIDSAINTSTGGYHITLFQRVVLTIKKKTKQNLFQMRKKFVFMKDFTKVTEHKQPFTSVNQACYLYETAT